jgi:hypothetical protein
VESFYIDLKKLDVKSYRFRTICVGLNTMYTEFHEILIWNEIKSCKKDIEQISSSYDGPFSEEIQRLKRCISNKNLKLE